MRKMKPCTEEIRVNLSLMTTIIKINVEVTIHIIQRSASFFLTKPLCSWLKTKQNKSIFLFQYQQKPLLQPFLQISSFQGQQTLSTTVAAGASPVHNTALDL